MAIRTKLVTSFPATTHSVLPLSSLWSLFLSLMPLPLSLTSPNFSLLPAFLLPPFLLQPSLLPSIPSFLPSPSLFSVDLALWFFFTYAWDRKFWAEILLEWVGCKPVGSCWNFHSLKLRNFESQWFKSQLETTGYFTMGSFLWASQRQQRPYSSPGIVNAVPLELKLHFSIPEAC